MLSFDQEFVAGIYPLKAIDWHAIKWAATARETSQAAPLPRIILNRHPPDADFVKTELATFDGFWQCRTLDTGALVHPSQ
jgi:hypothetical protein